MGEEESGRSHLPGPRFRPDTSSSQEVEAVAAAAAVGTASSRGFAYRPHRSALPAAAAASSHRPQERPLPRG